MRKIPWKSIGILQIFLGLQLWVAPSLTQAQNCSPTQFLPKISGQELRPTQPGPLLPWESESLFKYTQQDYEWINSELRWGSAMEDTLAKWVEGIDGALSKMGRWNGRSFRGTDLPEKILADYQPGHVVVDKAYVSSSKFLEVVLKKWNPAHQRGGVLLVIDGKNGHDIENFAYLPDEHEVLFSRQTQFMVKSRCLSDASTSSTSADKVDQSFWIIELSEI